METKKLYYRDAYLHSFSARVVASKNGWLALDQTVFYPEGGGQPADYGYLQGRPVSDVQLDAAGQVWHRVELDLDNGATIEGRIDWMRRYDHMQQHTAQHVLSYAFDELFQAETVGFHLGQEYVTIDLDGPELGPAELEQAESLANAKLRGKLPVRSYELAPHMLPAAQLRKLPQVEGDVRLVEIGDIDLCPCGGTHVRDLGEVGLIKVIDSERKRGNTRVSFVAGQRAYRDYTAKHQQLVALSGLLSEPVASVVTAVERLQQSLQELEREEKRLRQQLLVGYAQELMASAEPIGPAGCIVQELTEYTLDEAKFLASYLVEQGPYLVLLGINTEPYRLVAAANAKLALPVGVLLRETVTKHQGKGGGSTTSAQGAVPQSCGPVALAELQNAGRELMRD